MKIVVLWEYSWEKPLAQNLVRVLEKMGSMLVHGKVVEGGVRIEASKTKVTINAIAAEAVRAIPDAIKMEAAEYVSGYVNAAGYYDKYSRAYPSSIEMDRMGREAARKLVELFPKESEPLKKNDKPVVPKPDTNKTGVTVRELDMWEDEECQSN